MIIKVKYEAFIELDKADGALFKAKVRESGGIKHMQDNLRKSIDKSLEKGSLRVDMSKVEIESEGL